MSTSYAPALELKPPTDHQEMILNHLSLVKAIARRIAANIPVHVELDDLIQAGTLGLVNAVERYDASRGVVFATYAKFRIRGAMMDSLRQLDWASRDLRRQHKLIQRATHDLTASLQRDPNDWEIAAQLRITVEDLRKTTTVMFCAEPVSSRRIDGDDLPAMDFPDKAEKRPDRICALQEMRTTLGAAMQELPERCQKLLLLYYTDEMSMKDIGGKFGINESRVSQIHKVTLSKMAKILAANGIHSSNALMC